MTRLNVNIDHIATIREARRHIEPSPIAAAVICELAGADGITVHLRGDRRHIQDGDVKRLRETVTSFLNLEMAATDEMTRIATKIKPDKVTLVPENPGEVTTEGGLDVVNGQSQIARVTDSLKQAGIKVSLFIDPSDEQIRAARDVGAQEIEICTAVYADYTTRPSPFYDRTVRYDPEKALEELERIEHAAWEAVTLELAVAAGHGLTYRNVRRIAEIGEIEELNIGHNIIARASLVGLDRAVREMIEAMRGRGGMKSE
jgi:pyridoxine 5-phosphate synthase